MLYTVFHDARTSGKGETDEKAAAYAIGQLNSRFNKHGYQFTTNGTGAYENVNILEYDNSGRGGKYYDWDKAYFRTAIYQTYDMSVSGATQNTNYYTSLSYTQDEGRLKMNSFDRVSGRLNLTQKVGKFLELTTNASLARTKKSVIMIHATRAVITSCRPVTCCGDSTGPLITRPASSGPNVTVATLQWALL